MGESPYIKVAGIYKKLREAETKDLPIYISAVIGFGKTEAVKYYFRNKKYIFLSGREGYLKETPDIEAMKERIVVIDDISWIMEDASKKYIVDLLYCGKKKVVLIGRGRLPRWLQIPSVELHFLFANEQDLALSEEECASLLEAMGVTLPTGNLKMLYLDTQGHPLTILYAANVLANGRAYNKDVLEEVRIHLFHYFDVALYKSWNEEMRDILLALCSYERFDVEMAEMVTGNSQVPQLLEEALTVGSFLYKHEDGSFEYRFTLKLFFRWKKSVIYTKEQNEENYRRAALYYEIHDRIDQALWCYNQIGDKKKMANLLKKNAEGHPGTALFFETRELYYQLPKEEIVTSPVLMCGMSMLYSLMLQPEKSEEWYEELRCYEKKASNGTFEKREAKVRLVYLDIALPHRGIKGIINILKNAAILCMNKEFKLPEFSVTSNLPSLMNGGLDFSDWSKNDKELAFLLKKPVELVLGKYGVGLVNIALAESGLEKGTMDDYEVSARLNAGYFMADTAGKMEISFVATGLLIKQHISKGQIQLAQSQLKSFHKKVLQEKLAQLTLNLETMEMWIELLQGNMTSVKVWMEKAPNENLEFYILDRYRYINKVRCYIVLGKLEEALALIERLNVYFTKYERHYLWIENQLLKAIVLYRLNNEEWENVLNMALEKAESYHFTKIISWEGIAIKPLLERKKISVPKIEYWDTVLSEVKQMAAYYPEYLREEQVIEEAFTDMEKRVLKLLCNRISSEEICKLCAFSYSTLKFHNRNIYRKLGVKNRKEAEREAVRLNLV